MPSVIDETLIRGEMARRDLAEFVKLFWNVVEPSYAYKHNWHIDVICKHLTNIYDVKNLLVNIPPRCCKTLLVGVFWPAWTWIHKPTTRFLFASYGEDLSLDTSVKCRDLMQSDLYQKLYGKKVKLRKDVQSKKTIWTMQGGAREATSVGGKALGFGADILVCDDPHNARKVESDLERDSVIRWFSSSFRNRLNDAARGGRVVIGQRVHRKDLSDHLIEAGGWHHVNLPYEYKGNAPSPTGMPALECFDPRSNPGQALWPERFPEDEIRQYKSNRYVFEVQYNQTPQNAEAAIFKADNFQTARDDGECYIRDGKRIPKANCYRIASADLAVSTKSGADYSAFVIADIASSGEIIVVHVHRERIESTKLTSTMQLLNDTFRPGYWVTEDVAFQRVIIDQMKAASIKVMGRRPEGDKQARAFPLQMRFEQKQVFFLEGKPWIPALEAELLSFPGGSFDDQCDALAYLGIEANRYTRHQPVIETPKEVSKEQRIEHEKRAYAKALTEGLF